MKTMSGGSNAAKTETTSVVSGGRTRVMQLPARSGASLSGGAGSNSSAVNGVARPKRASSAVAGRSPTLADALSIDLPSELRVADATYAERSEHKHFLGGDDREMFSVLVMQHEDACLSGGVAAFERVFIGRAGLAALLIHCLRRFEAEFCAASPAHPYTSREPEVVVDADADGEAAAMVLPAAGVELADAVERPAAPEPKMMTRRKVRRAS